LRSAGRLSAVHLCEYGAQAMALHGGLLARAAGRGPDPGLLVALRDVRLRVLRIDDLPGELVVSAECLQSSTAGLHYRFEVRHAGAVIADGRVAAICRRT
jgi:predicted hotdog family 3-hydroxylacyl-ACP dehydratase